MVGTPERSESSGNVVVVDFGAQYAQLIARRVREAHVHSSIVSHRAPLEEIVAGNPSGIILSGGPASVHVPGAPGVDPRLWKAGVPILGICYGAQLMALGLGGVVQRTSSGEFGGTPLEVRGDSRLIGVLGEAPKVWMSHSDQIIEAPADFKVTASAPNAAVAAMENPSSALYAVQFHPEVAHTAAGQELLERFLFEVCGCSPEWTPSSIIHTATESIRKEVGSDKVICALSGGVDSAVAAALVFAAVGSQLTCVFVDTGLMRKGEAPQVVETFRRQFGMDLLHVDAEGRFMDALADLSDPELKRKAVGETFIRVFEEVARERSDAAFLVQGTLYPDVIESGGADAAAIKSHHNVGGLPERMDLRLVEPLRDLFKDEVRAVGHELGLPDEIIWRQPFPGPGLAVRIIGPVTEERVAILREADAIVREEIAAAGLERELWQAFAILPVVRTVGVQGDGRSYAYPVVVRAVTSEDAMTADWARLPWQVLERCSTRIVNEVAGVNRVAYDVTSKPPGTIEWE